LALLSFATTVFLALLAIMNPLANVPIFLALTDGMDAKEQKQTARRAVMYAFFLGMVFVLLGHVILNMMGISLNAFRIAGGIILFMIAYGLLQGHLSSVHHAPDEANAPSHEADDVAVVPLAMPILTGPGTIATLMTLPSKQPATMLGLVTVLFVFLVLLSITYFLFAESQRVVKYVSPSMIRLITRLMGLLLTVLAVQMVVEGIQGFFK